MVGIDCGEGSAIAYWGVPSFGSRIYTGEDILGNTGTVVTGVGGEKVATV